MKNSVMAFALVLALGAMVLSSVGCGGGKAGVEQGTAPEAPTNVKLGAAENYDHGLTFAAPEGWEKAGRQGKIIVKFDNPSLDGQSVFVKNPEPTSVQTLQTTEDVKTAGLTGEMIKIGPYVWLRKTQKSRDSKTEDTFDNLICSTVQFGKIFTVTVRGYQNQNDNVDGIMNAVLNEIKFSEAAAQEEPVTIDENTEFNLDF